MIWSRPFAKPIAWLELQFQFNLSIFYLRWKKWDRIELNLFYSLLIRGSYIVIMVHSNQHFFVINKHSHVLIEPYFNRVKSCWCGVKVGLQPHIYLMVFFFIFVLCYCQYEYISYHLAYLNSSLCACEKAWRFPVVLPVHLKRTLLTSDKSRFVSESCVCSEKVSGGEWEIRLSLSLCGYHFFHFLALQMYGCH